MAGKNGAVAMRSPGVSVSPSERVNALELLSPGVVARAGLVAVDAFEALSRLAEGDQLRILAIAPGVGRSAVIGRADRAPQRDGLRAGVPAAEHRAERAAAEIALWIALGARAAEVERVELAGGGVGSALGALARGRVDLAWTEEDLALVPAQVIPWVTFGSASEGSSGLPSPRGPVVIVARASSLATDRAVIAGVLRDAIDAALLADDAVSWAHVAGRRRWSLERARAVFGDSLAAGTRLSLDERSRGWLDAYAQRLVRIDALSRAVDLERAYDARCWAHAERLSVSGGSLEMSPLVHDIEAVNATRPELAVAL